MGPSQKSVLEHLEEPWGTKAQPEPRSTFCNSPIPMNKIPAPYCNLTGVSSSQRFEIQFPAFNQTKVKLLPHVPLTQPHAQFRHCPVLAKTKKPPQSKAKQLYHICKPRIVSDPHFFCESPRIRACLRDVTSMVGKAPPRHVQSLTNSRLVSFSCFLPISLKVSRMESCYTS